MRRGAPWELRSISLTLLIHVQGRIITFMGPKRFAFLGPFLYLYTYI